MTTATVPLAQQIGCVQRELKMRRALYPKWVRAQRKTQEAATAGIAEMEAVLETLRGLATADDLLAPLSGLPMLSPDGELLAAEDIVQWCSWCNAAIRKLESATALGGWMREMNPHFASMEKAGHQAAVQEVRDAAAVHLDALAAEGVPA